MGARKSGHERTQTLKRTNCFGAHENLVKRAQTSGHIRFWSGIAQKNSTLNARKKLTKIFERMIVWAYALSVWDCPDMGTFCPARFEHRDFPSGVVRTYLLWIWQLSAGRKTKNT